jgi:hypothetical protein
VCVCVCVILFEIHGHVSGKINMICMFMSELFSSVYL